MLRDAKYRAKLPFRARGHAELVDRVGGIFVEIDARLETHERLRVLELGCGYGTVLLEIGHRYGSRVEAHGINREPRDGNVDLLRRNGLERGLIAPEDATTHPLPTIAYVDVADGLPYADDTFDVMSRVKEIHVPTLVTCGADDRLTPVKYHQYLAAQIPLSELTIVEKAGHWMFWEQADAFTKHLRAFLDRLPSAAGPR